MTDKSVFTYRRRRNPDAPPHDRVYEVEYLGKTLGIVRSRSPKTWFAFPLGWVKALNWKGQASFATREDAATALLKRDLTMPR